MTTLADINQTLVDQGEAQERTVEAIESLVGRIADLVNFAGRGPDDRLDELEDRREKAAEERRNRMDGMKKVVQAVDKNSGLIAKLLGAGAVLGLLYFSSEEFRNDINSVFTEAGDFLTKKVSDYFSGDFKTHVSQAFEAVIVSAKDFFKNQDTGTQALILGTLAAGLIGPLRTLRLAVRAIRVLAKPLLALAGLGGALGAGAASATPKPIPAPRRTGGGLNEARNLRNQQRASAARLSQANAAQQRFSTAQKLSAIKPQATLGQRIGNLAANAGRALLNPRNLIRGGIITEGIYQTVRPTELADGTLVGGAQRVLENPELYSQAAIDEAAAIMEAQNARMNAMRLDYERGEKGFEGTVESELYKPGALQGVEDFLQNQRDKPIGFEGAAPIPFLGRFFGQNNVQPVPGSSGMNIMQATENLGGAPGGGATVIQQDNSTNTYIQGGGGGGGTSGGVVPIPSDINVQRLDILGNFGTGRLM